MARARNLKPSLFKNEVLGSADPIYTLLFQGLWVLADREGRLEDRPLRIKGETFPYRDDVNIDEALGWLHDHGFIVRYATTAGKFITVLNFVKHQNPHKKEPKSDIPAPDQRTSKGRRSPAGSGKAGARPGKSGTGPADSLLLIPDSGFPLADSGLPESGSGPDQTRPVVADSPKPTGRFTPPTAEDVAAYCRERPNPIDPVKFVNHYTANGWRVGRNPMRDWKAAVRTWEGNEFNRGPPGTLGVIEVQGKKFIANGESSGESD